MAALAAGAAPAGGGSVAHAEDVTITVWSHEADEPAKVAFRETGGARPREGPSRACTSRSPGTRRMRLYAALKTALPAGQGPDVFYLEPDQTEYITNGYIVPLDDLVDWSKIHDWARAVWTHDGKTWALPQEAYTNEIYYNKDMLKKLGVDAAGERRSSPRRSSSTW